MYSMTGFGRGQIEKGGVRIQVEIRTLNQRFFELKLNLPRGWTEYEAEIRKLVQAAVARGRVEVTIRRVVLRMPTAKLMVNDQLARQYVEELRRLGRRLKLDGRLGIEAILQRPEIFQVTEREGAERREVALAMKALARALKMLQADRAREGLSLKRDLAARIAKIAAAGAKIRKLSEESRAAIMENFQVRMRELLANVPLDERRLYDEAASAAQRADISEELTRLGTHLAGLKEMLSRRGAVGRSIEFLLQEVNREVNTIGAKSQNAALSRLAVEVKAELEKMREQVQNVE